MPNRLDIELTSARGDGTYTWRAAGARQPKGVIDSKILSDRAKVGDILRVEAEVEIDGITILSVLPSKEKATPSGRIELLGSSKPIAAVTTVLVSEGGRGDRRDLLDSPRRGGGGTRDRRPSRGGERPDARRPRPEGGAEGGDRRPEGRPRVEGTPGGGSSTTPRRPERPATDRRPERRPRTEGAPADASAAGTSEQRRPRPPSAGGSRPGTPAGQRDRRPESRQPVGAHSASPSVRKTPPRFEPGTAHREVLLAALAPEQRPIAERLAAGGIPAVRRAIAEERERARAEGRPEVSGDAILALAEQLAPSVKQAIWLDRAEAAVAQLEQLSLRDLRTTVAAAAPRDETARELDRKLREELDRRIKKLRSSWEDQITRALEEGRVLQALRFSAQPPEPTARFPAGLVERLAASAGAAMTTSTPIERWLAVLDAAAASPIRRQIHPEGLPEDPSGEIVRKARLAAGSIPALAPMIGLPMPPPPKPIRGARPPRPPRLTGRAPNQAATGTNRPMSSAVVAEESPAEASQAGLSEAEVVPEAPQHEELPETPRDEIKVDVEPETSQDETGAPDEAVHTATAPEDLEPQPEPASADEEASKGAEEGSQRENPVEDQSPTPADSSGS
jgi:hypothetical protein